MRGELRYPGSEPLHLEPRSVDADTQAFLIPAGAAGRVHLSFVADRAYRVSLGLGGALAALTTAFCLLALSRRPRRAVTAALPAAHHSVPSHPTSVIIALMIAATMTLVAGLPGLATAAAAWAVTRWTTLRADYLAGALALAAGAMLARAPWPSDGYAGDSLLVQLLCVAAITCACLPPHRIH